MSSTQRNKLAQSLIFLSKITSRFIATNLLISIEERQAFNIIKKLIWKCFGHYRMEVTNG